MISFDIIDRLKAHSIEFTVAPDGSIRSKNGGLCPICALCLAERGVKYSNSAVQLAADELNLSNFTRLNVILAADGVEKGNLYHAMLQELVTKEYHADSTPLR